MLREVPNARQNPDEHRRRCFFSLDQELVVWIDETGDPISFEFSYNKRVSEHLIRWKSGQGFMHYRVDNGEADPLRKQTPILLSDGVFDVSPALKAFMENSAEMPRGLVAFIRARLNEYPGFHEDS